MKKIMILSGILVYSISVLSQTIYIANNNTGAVTGTNVFTGNGAIASALAVASTGDIIYVVPSGTRYDATNVTKSVTIFGAGFNPDKQNSVTSRTLNLTIMANNVRISGVAVEGMLQVTTGMSGIMVDKCRVNRFNLSTGVGSVIIQNCIFGENSSSNYSLQSDNTNTSVRISNNIVYGATDGWFYLVSGAIIEHNVFVGLTGFPGLNVFRTAQFCSIKNNIFLGVEPRAWDEANFTNNDQQFNLSFGATDNTFISGVNGNTAANNIVGSNPLFVNLPTVANPPFHNHSYDANLQVTSPAKGTGEGGIDMGAFGGPTPFDPFGTSLPIVQSIIAPGTVTQGTNMNVRVQAKGN